MVTQLDGCGAHGTAWMLQPTRSMTWREAKRLLWGVALASLAIGSFFLAQGFPLVLPFSGLEAFALACAFYVVLKDGERREVVRLEGDRLVVEVGARELEHRHEFNRFWVRVELTSPRYRTHRSRLVVAAQGRRVELGGFLTDGERESFARLLINALAKNR